MDRSSRPLRIVAGVLSTLLLVVSMSACEKGNWTSMVSVAPPSNWLKQVDGFRERRDRYFRTSPDTPLLASDVATFDGLDYWAPDPAYYFAGPMRLHAQPHKTTCVTTAGQARDCDKYGWFEFVLEGVPVSLQVYRLLDSAAPDGTPNFLVAFTDLTSGKDTYPAGRYVDLNGTGEGPYVLDFNLAYNPSCAYGDPGRFACPRAPAENGLPVAVEAGERGFKHPTAGS